MSSMYRLQTSQANTLASDAAKTPLPTTPTVSASTEHLANTTTAPSPVSPGSSSQQFFSRPALDFTEEIRPSKLQQQSYSASISPPFLKTPKSFSTHRKLSLTSVDSIPRQTLLKALASRRPSLDPVSIAANLNTAMKSPLSLISPSEPSELDGLKDYAIDGAFSTPGTAKLLAQPLNSPCFYHQRFDNTINVDRVLEEIAGDEYNSHSRLMQTALGVREVARQLHRRTCKMAVQNVMIVTKARDNQLVNLTREVTHWLMKTPRYGGALGVNVYVDKKLKESKRFDAPGLLKEEPKFKDMLRYWTPDLCWSSPESFDLVLTLGGDGTVLFTSWLFQRVVPPILSFSLGSLGFLTNFKFDLYKEHLNKVFMDGMRVNMRMRFTCTVYRAEESGEMSEGDQFEVLNELVIDRGPSPYVSNLELYGDDDLLTVIQADGCIFSTPTGSTAYSLSAGGSLVHPDIPAILLTPICPHTLSFRPMLLNDSILLRVSVPKGSRATAWCAFDGKGRVELKQGDHVTIAASQYPFPTVLSAPTEWIDSISRTLRWNTRASQQKAWDGDSAIGEGEEGKIDSWDIDMDSGCYNSEGEEDSPLRRQMTLLGF